MRKRVTIKLYKLIIIGVTFLFGGIIGKLGYIVFSPQVDGVNLTAFVKNRNLVKQTLYARRGSIFDVNGNVLAQQVASYTLIAYLEPSRTTNPKRPQHVVAKEMTAEKLAPLINLTPAEILARLNKKAYQVEFGPRTKNLTEIEKNAIEALELPGIDFIQSSQRYYKMGSLAPYIIGYGKPNKKGKLKGEMGIEKQFNRLLEGKDGKKIYQRDAYGYQIPNTPSLIQEAEAGADVYLTLDNNIQIMSENALTDLGKDHQFKWATLTIMDAQSGAIVASASYPSFNLNNLSTIESYLNPLVSYEYEPGSTMKMYSFMAAMEDGIYHGSELYRSGQKKVADVVISDFNETGWGKISFDKGFIYSSNVASTTLGLKLGGAKLKEYYRKFGFGSKTGIELPGESSGNLDFKYLSEIATATFGQGITTTPIQNLQALTVIANDGIMLKPYIVAKVVGPDGHVIVQNQRKEVGQVVSSETTNQIKDLMEQAIYNGLTTAYRTSKVTLIGKTGTAQIPTATGYLTGKYNTIKSFAGMFPKDNPKYLVYFSTRQFEGNTKAIGKVITKVIEDIAKYAQLTVETSDLDLTKIKKLPNFINQEITTVTEYATANGIELVPIGSGSIVIDQFPRFNQELVVGAKLLIKTNDSEIKLPDLTGWSCNEVISLCKMLNLKYLLNGYGYVESFNLAPGTILKPNDVLEINLKVPSNLLS